MCNEEGDQWVFTEVFEHFFSTYSAHSRAKGTNRIKSLPELVFYALVKTFSSNLGQPYPWAWAWANLKIIFAHTYTYNSFLGS